MTVPEGATAGEVSDLLTKNDVVSNGTLFEWRLKLAGKSDAILPGRYVLAHDMSYGNAIDELTSSGGKVNVTIPEGEDRNQIADTISDLGLNGDYLAASKSFKGFDPSKYGAKNPRSLEGFLFPATYQLDPGADVSPLVSEQLQAFQQNIAGVNLSYAKSKNLTVYDVLTIASMIDKEVQIASERPLVAAVIYNRLHRGMPLGIDATTRFQFHNYTGDITRSQLQVALSVQHADQRRAAADADRQPGPRRDQGGRAPRQGQLPLLRPEWRQQRAPLLHRQRGASSTSSPRPPTPGTRLPNCRS